MFTSSNPVFYQRRHHKILLLPQEKSCGLTNTAGVFFIFFYCTFMLDSSSWNGCMWYVSTFPVLICIHAKIRPYMCSSLLLHFLMKLNAAFYCNRCALWCVSAYCFLSQNGSSLLKQSFGRSCILHIKVGQLQLGMHQLQFS